MVSKMYNYKRAWFGCCSWGSCRGRRSGICYRLVKNSYDCMHHYTKFTSSHLLDDKCEESLLIVVSFILYLVSKYKWLIIARKNSVLYDNMHKDTFVVKLEMKMQCVSFQCLLESLTVSNMQLLQNIFQHKNITIHYCTYLNFNTFKLS